MAAVEHRHTERGMSAGEQDKKQFVDFVRIHAISGKLITRDDEMKVLKEGITRFGMNLDEATGVLLSAAADRRIALVSQAEEHLATMLEQLVKRSKIGQKEFDDVCAVYAKLTNGILPTPEIRKRIKQMVQERGWNGRRTHWLFGSRKWFKRI